MKILFDTNVYVAEALVGEAAVAMLAATVKAGWRIVCSNYILDEIERVLVEYRARPKRFAARTRRHVLRRCQLIEPPPARHQVPSDPDDSPILKAAIAGGCDYLVSNDAHLLALNPYESLRIVSMADYYELLRSMGHLVEK